MKREWNCLFTDDKVAYTENQMQSSKKPSEFSKFARYKINMQNIIVFVNISNKQSEMEILKNTIYISIKNMNLG